MTEIILDLTTLIFNLSLFSVILLLLIIYPKIKLKKILKRISTLNRS